MPSLDAKSNPYLDEVNLNTLKTSSVNGRTGATVNPDAMGGMETLPGGYEHLDPSKENFMNERPDLEIDQSEQTKIDEFSGFNPKKDKILRDKDEEGKRRRRQRRIGKKKRIGALDDEDFEDEELNVFFSFLDQMWQKLSEVVEEVFDEFANWNNWFKKEKKKPPSPRKIKGAYIREEYNTKRNPHLWKSDPFKKWILAFGPSHGNNTVSDILYKYQNETVSKDA